MTVRIITTHTTKLTHLLAQQDGDTISQEAARAHPRAALCGRKISGWVGTQQTGPFSGKGYCVTCRKYGVAREILAADLTPRDREAAKVAALVGQPLPETQRPADLSLASALRGQLVRYLIGRTITCLNTGEVLDIRTAVVLSDRDGDPSIVLSQKGWRNVSARPEAVAALAARGYTIDTWTVAPPAKPRPARRAPGAGQTALV